MSLREHDKIILSSCMLFETFIYTLSKSLGKSFSSHNPDKFSMN